MTGVVTSLGVGATVTLNPAGDEAPGIDGLVAGPAMGRFEGLGPAEALRLGTPAGAATATTRGTALGTASDVWRPAARLVVAELQVHTPRAA